MFYWAELLGRRREIMNFWQERKNSEMGSERSSKINFLSLPVLSRVSLEWRMERKMRKKERKERKKEKRIEKEGKEREREKRRERKINRVSSVLSVMRLLAKFSWLNATKFTALGYKAEAVLVQQFGPFPGERTTQHALGISYIAVCGTWRPELLLQLRECPRADPKESFELKRQPEVAFSPKPVFSASSSLRHQHIGSWWGPQKM